MKTFIRKIQQLGACKQAIEFVKTCESPVHAWNTCTRADWMLWLIGNTMDVEAERKTLVTIACECARLALPYTKDPRVLKCIEVTEAWVRGEATVKQVRT